MFNTATSHQMLQYPEKPMEGRANNIWKPSNGVAEIAPNCPRCASPNTKFCYYNNYSLSQPRYFCKGCRRYWTKGGSLRNVPVGGGCRKARRSRSRSSAKAQAQRVHLDYKVSSPNGASPDIDMAEVFAKFLNENQSNAEEHSSSGASFGSADRAGLESCDIPSNYLIIEEGAQFQFQFQNELLPQMFVGEEYEDNYNYIIQDFMTSEPQTMSPGFGSWQQDFATYSYDDLDQLKIAGTTEDAINWSSAPLPLDILPSACGNY